MPNRLRSIALSAPLFALSIGAVADKPLAQHRAITGLAAPAVVDGSGILTWSSAAPDAINMHVVRAPDGLILVDTLRRADQVDEALAIVRKLREPVRAILLTHAHTDHYGGVPYWRAYFPDVPIYASAAIRDEIRDDLFPDNARRRAMFGSLFPTQEELNRHLPTEFVADRAPFVVAGMTLTPMVLGPSESPAAVVYVGPGGDSAFVGDLVNVLTVAAPTISLTAWLEQLDQIERALKPDTTLYVGHGPSGPAAALIAEQRDYLQLLDRLVSEAGQDSQGVDEQETAAIVRAMRVAYPHYGGAAALPPEALIRESVGWVAEQHVRNGRVADRKIDVR